jgi:hypothetical protein
MVDALKVEVAYEESWDLNLSSFLRGYTRCD